MTCPYYKEKSTCCKPIRDYHRLFRLEDATKEAQREADLFLWHFKMGYCTKLDCNNNGKFLSCACFVKFSKNPLPEINPSRRDDYS